MSALHGFLFQVYPYVCFTVFLVGSLIRFDHGQYSWKSDSSQMLRTGTLRWGSNLFHVGILFLFFGHLVGLFTPHAVYGVFMSAARAVASTGRSVTMRCAQSARISITLPSACCSE